MIRPRYLCILLLLKSSHVFVQSSTMEESMETRSAPSTPAAAIEPWPPATETNPSLQSLFREYSRIFRHGNRNAASHRWATFVLERAEQMTPTRVEFFMSGFCAVSGSPVRPNDYNRYRLRLPLVNRRGTGTTAVTGFMYYCCWPCVCDTQDYIRVDTKNITSVDGISRRYYFAVIGNPCDNPQALHTPFVQPFGHRTTTTLAETAREVRCLPGGVLDGATLSDHGYIIIGMFFDAFVDESSQDAAPLATHDQQPGRISTTEPLNGRRIMFQDEREWDSRCTDRASQGYNSGMGEIFRKVSAISPIPVDAENSLAGSDILTTLSHLGKPDGSPQECLDDPALSPSCDKSLSHA